MKDNNVQNLDIRNVVFICTYSTIVVCKNTDILNYLSVRSQSLDSVDLDKVWNGIEIFIENKNFVPLSSAIVLDKLGFVNSTINNKHTSNSTYRVESLNFCHGNYIPIKNDLEFINQNGLKNDTQEVIDMVVVHNCENIIKSSNVQNMTTETKGINKHLNDEKSQYFIKKSLKRKQKKKKQKERKRNCNSTKNKLEETKDESIEVEIENERSDESDINENDLSISISSSVTSTLTEMSNKKEKSKFITEDLTEEDQIKVDQKVALPNIKIKEQEIDIGKKQKTDIKDHSNSYETKSSTSNDSFINDIDFDNDEDMPAFVKSLYYKSVKKEDSKSLKKNTPKSLINVKKERKPKKTNSQNNTNEILELQAVSKLKSARLCIGKACDANMKGQHKLVIECFTRAIQLEPNNLGHYLNRSYYYLRNNLLKQAFNDSVFVIQKAKNTLQIALAKFILGQIYYNLEKFTKAETYFKESLNLNPRDKRVHRELLYLQMKQLNNMGFAVESILEVLYESEEITDACNKLFLKNSNKKQDEVILPFNDVNEVYYSDDENEINNIDSLTSVMNYRYEKNEQIKINESNGNLSVPMNNDFQLITRKMTKSKISNNYYNDYDNRTIWIGNLKPSITNAMIKKKFNRYGKIISVSKPVKDAWAFINFENPVSLTDILEEGANCVINDVKIAVRPKSKKY